MSPLFKNKKIRPNIMLNKEFERRNGKQGQSLISQKIKALTFY